MSALPLLVSVCVFFCVWILRFSFRLIYVFGTHTHAHERKRRIFVVVVIWNLPLKQRCCCCCFLFISKILFCYYVVGISLYFYNSFLFYFAYILLHSARHYDLNRLVKIQIICMLVVTFLTFSLRFLLHTLFQFS